MPKLLTKRDTALARRRKDAQPALEASIQIKRIEREVDATQEQEATMVQPFYTPPPGPGALPDGKRVFLCSVAGHVIATIVAISEEDARGLYEEELKARGINHALGYDIREIGQGETVVLHSVG